MMNSVQRGRLVELPIAIRARMVPDLAKSSRSVEDALWQTFGHDTDGTLRQWAELDDVPALPTETKSATPRRYIGLRFLKLPADVFVHSTWIIRLK